MFENIGMAEILILVVAGLFILGPERLPEAARWLGNAVRQAKEYITGAQTHLKNELGPEFDELRQPLNELRGLRSLNPKTAITRSLFSDDAPVKPNGHAPGVNGAASAAAAGAAAGAAAQPATPAPAPRPEPTPLARGEQPPIDPDAT